VKLSKGTPFSVTTAARDLNFDSFSEFRPILLDPTVLGRSINNPANSRQLLPATAFRTLNVTDVGATGKTPVLLGRNTFYGDGVKTVDIGFAKTFPMPWEGHKFTLRADLFNAFNHVQYGFPVSLDIANLNFAAITGTATQYAPRTVQFSLRYQY
jgi:hypothetical protein